MRRKLLKILSCVKCAGDLELKVKSKDGDQIISGDLICNKCRSSYPIINGIPRFVDTDKYVSSFSFEWSTHQETQLDSRSGKKESRKTFYEKTLFDPKKIKNKAVLDVGCGSGRFAEVATKAGAMVVAVDLSFAVDAARKNFLLKDPIEFIQADVFKLPFKKDSFDYIYSLGVLHHTPDTKKAFSGLVKFLKPGGRVAIWVYSRWMIGNLKTADFLRRWTSRMDKRLLHLLSYVAVPYYYLTRIPAMGTLFAMLLPISPHPDPKWRVLDTFDWYSPTYQWKHTTAEVYRWFTELKLTNIKIGDYEVSISGTK